MIELARANDLHVLCILSHTSHVLQPLDVGVFKSNFSKACSGYLGKNPSRVITTNIIASLIATAWPNSLTPNNNMGGFRKTGVFPLNPGAIDDKQLRPSHAVGSKPSLPDQDGGDSDELLFSPTKERLFETRFKKGYDVTGDPEYSAWLKIRHPTVSLVVMHLWNWSPHLLLELVVSHCPLQWRKLVYQMCCPIFWCCHNPNLHLNNERNETRTVCITDTETLEELKAKEAEKLKEQNLKKENSWRESERRLEKKRKNSWRESKRGLSGKGKRNSN